MGESVAIAGGVLSGPATSAVMPRFRIRTPLPEAPFAENLSFVVAVKVAGMVTGPPVM